MIESVTYEEAMRRWRYLYRMEKLPHGRVSGAEWYSSEYGCAALAWIGNSRKTARIKGTVIAPECRRQGHGEAMLQHLMREAVKGGAERLEVFARNPEWYLRNGFSQVRVTDWGVTVCSMQLLNV